MTGLVRRMRPFGYLCLAGVLAWSVPMAARSRSVWDGIYAPRQVERGKTVYVEICLRCHGETLLGGDDARALVGETFMARWSGKALWDLFDITRRTMPDDGPAVLTRAQTANLMAYLLSANGVPAGQTDLTPDDAALKDIQITRAK